MIFNISKPTQEKDRRGDGFGGGGGKEGVFLVFP